VTTAPPTNPGQWPVTGAGTPAARTADGSPGQCPLRVLQVVPRFYPELGGLETHVAAVTRRLADRDDIDITVLATDRSGRLAQQDTVDGVRVLRRRSWPRKRDYYFSPGIMRVIADGGWDVVHFQSVHTLVPIVGMIAARRAGIPYVLSFHSGGYSSGVRARLSGLQWKLLTPLLARSARLVAVSRFEKRRFSEATGIAPEHFVIIQNGGSLPPQGGDVRPLPGRIVSSGRLERYKGHHKAIEALPAVRRRIPDADLLILGGGTYEQPLRELADELGVGTAVQIRHLPPSDRSAMADELARSSVMVALSSYEAHPIGIMEAVASGLPVLGFDVAGIGDLVEDGLVRGIDAASSADEIADALVDLLSAKPSDQPHERPDIALPTWEGCSDSLAQLYRDVARHAVPAVAP
jgi:glycosyltransferase involved in cell wall biosynthesis